MSTLVTVIIYMIICYTKDNNPRHNTNATSRPYGRTTRRKMPILLIAIEMSSRLTDEMRTVRHHHSQHTPSPLTWCSSKVSIVKMPTVDGACGVTYTELIHHRNGLRTNAVCPADVWTSSQHFPPTREYHGTENIPSWGRDRKTGIISSHCTHGSVTCGPYVHTRDIDETRQTLLAINH